MEFLPRYSVPLLSASTVSDNCPVGEQELQLKTRKSASTNHKYAVDITRLLILQWLLLGEVLGALNESLCLSQQRALIWNIDRILLVDLCVFSISTTAYLLLSRNVKMSWFWTVNAIAYTTGKLTGWIVGTITVWVVSFVAWGQTDIVQMRYKSLLPALLAGILLSAVCHGVAVQLRLYSPEEDDDDDDREYTSCHHRSSYYEPLLIV